MKRLKHFVTWELYNWWLQLMKLNYTEVHYVKPLGITKANQIIDIMQDDLEDGIDVKIIPGQIVPNDRIYKQEKALEEYQGGLITPLDYYRETGKEDPDAQYKRLIMFQVNPTSLVQFSEEELAQMSQLQNKSKEQVSGDDEAAQLEQYLQSPEFQKLPPEQQQEQLGRAQERLNQLKGVQK